jgi:hypothetical protein
MAGATSMNERRVLGSGEQALNGRKWVAAAATKQLGVQRPS